MCQQRRRLSCKWITPSDSPGIHALSAHDGTIAKPISDAIHRLIETDDFFAILKEIHLIVAPN